MGEPRALGRTPQQTCILDQWQQQQQEGALAQLTDLAENINFATSSVNFMAHTGEYGVERVHVTDVEPARKTRREVLESVNGKLWEGTRQRHFTGLLGKETLEVVDQLLEKLKALDTKWLNS